MTRLFEVPAIVLGGGINGLGMVRNLGKSGVPVFCVCKTVDPAFFSRYCLKRFLIHSFEEDALRRFLREFSKKETARPVVFSTDDIGTLALSRLQGDIKDDFELVVPRKEAAERLIIKRKFYEFLAENDIPHPQVVIPSDVNDLKRVKKELGYPVFVRPSLSPIFNTLFHKKGFLAYSENELIRFCDLTRKNNIDVIFQEIIQGPDSGIYGIAGYFDKRSRPVALFAYHRLRGWPPVFGNNSLIESVALSTIQSAKETATKCLSQLGYHGVMEAEFKLDPRDNRFKMLEINARSWWQNSFPTKCGLNIIFKAYLDAIGEHSEYSESYLTGLKWINFLTDLPSSILTNEIATKTWVHSLRMIRDEAFFDPRDPIPPMTTPICQISKLLLR